MRITLLTTEFPSVSETFVEHQVMDLLARGHRVDVFPQQAGGVGEPDPEAAALLRHRHLGPPVPARRGARVAGAARLIGARGWRRARPLLRSCNPRRFGRRGLSLSLLYRGVPLLDHRAASDLVHCHHGPVALDALQLQRLGLLPGPLVVSFHGHDLNVAPSAGRRAARGSRSDPRDLYAALWPRAALLLVGSGFARERLLALGAPPSRVRLQPVGVRPADFPRATPAAASAQPRLLSVGRLVPVKGFDVALRAFAALARQAPEWRYVIVGDGPLRGELERLAEQLGVASRVRFTGALSHAAVRRELAAAHLYCQPSVRGADGAEETQGLAVVEAQAAGLPVVASRSGGLPESLRDGITGLLAEPGDVRDWWRALRALALHPERRARLGSAGRDFAARHFDRAHLCDQLLGHYDEVSSGRVRAAAESGATGRVLRDAAPRAGRART